MGRYLIRRFAELILTVFLIATATFFLLEAVPGDPLTQRADHLPEQTRTALYQRYGLDKPVMERYLITMKKMCKGDFGESFVYAGQTVTGLLKTKLPVSARLGIQQMLLGVTLGLLLGTVALGMAYGMGAVAPILYTGAVMVADVPGKLTDPFMSLPYHLYMLVNNGFSLDYAYGTAFVLMLFLLLIQIICKCITYIRKDY